ncbi:N-carbamoyl-L-amino-acid_hydrolase / Beta-ureidopropionase [Hexamita inflata]|uniref:N-carbamoyl-L-amino-acid hydrolase / Beta-ureidopropionase n=1 Tax=Hexamita inflata TaxID=28002 RepID=A0AA86QSU5_9EUKA|nr:N-carbamoyl-L-amino-acid hydrolase / Beta-ureidopropionase [Hexamita inflata]
MNPNIRINGKRLRESLETMAKIGGTPNGGVQRLALSDEDKTARDLLCKWLKEIDCEVFYDEMGNIFGKRAGTKPELTPIMSGSHGDSQPKGGRFDGILGVMGALEVLRTLHENKVELLRPVMLVQWTNEEGSRFSPAMVSSGVWSGALTKEWAYSRTDRDGKTQGAEIERIGYKGKLPCKNWPTHAYYELHIEQGPMLEKKGMTIGAPKGILCLHWYDIYLKGAANQVGPTPMEGRNDALVAASEMIIKVNELPAKMGGNMVATVGEIQCMPNSRNIIPDDVHFTVDIRSWDDELAIKAWEDLLNDFKAISVKRGTPMTHEITWRVEHAPFNRKMVDRVISNAKAFNYPVMEWVSGAGHDASYMNQVAPTAMVFVPSIGGRSHVECEDTKWEDCEAGANVLLHSIMQSANEVE